MHLHFHMHALSNTRTIHTSSYSELLVHGWMLGKILVHAHTHTHTHTQQQQQLYNKLHHYLYIDALFNQLTKKSTFASRKSGHDNIYIYIRAMQRHMPIQQVWAHKFHTGMGTQAQTADCTIHFPSFFSNSLDMLYHLAIATLYFCISTHKHK